MDDAATPCDYCVYLHANKVMIPCERPVWCYYNDAWWWAYGCIALCLLTKICVCPFCDAFGAVLTYLELGLLLNIDDVMILVLMFLINTDKIYVWWSYIKGVPMEGVTWINMYRPLDDTYIKMCTLLWCDFMLLTYMEDVMWWIE